MCGLTVTFWGNPAEGMGDCFHLHCQAGGWDRIGCTVFVYGCRTLLDSEAPPWLSHQCTLWGLAVCCFLEWEAWSLDSVLPAGHSQQRFPKFSGGSVSQKCWNWFGYLSHSLVCLSSVSWHTCSIESSACVTHAQCYYNKNNKNENPLCEMTPVNMWAVCHKLSPPFFFYFKFKKIVINLYVLHC